VIRSYATFFLIAVMTLGLFFLVLTRGHVAYDAPSEIAPPPASASDAGDGGLARGATDAGVGVADGGLAVDAAAPGGRPLRVAALGWEVAAAGLAGALAASPGSAAAAAFEIAPEADLDAIAARLARGGDSEGGADLAVMPAASFVVAYEKLRVLDPRAIAVVGFSRGREELRAAPGALAALVRAPPSSDDVKLVATAPQMALTPESRALGSESATVLGLFVLREMGLAPSRVRFVSPGTVDARGASFAALTALSMVAKGTMDERKPALSTSDASRLAPIVVVAPRAVLDAREAAVKDVVRAWLDGVARLVADAAPVARALSDGSASFGRALSDAGARPELASLVERLGKVSGASLAEQGALVLGGGPGALPATLALTWSLAREGGLAPSAAPDPLPIDPRVVRALGAAAPPAPAALDVDPADAGALAFGAAPSSSTVLFVVRDPGGLTAPPKGKVTPEALAPLAMTAGPGLASIAALFPRAVLRVSSPLGERAARTFAAGAVAAGVPASRVVLTTSLVASAQVLAVEVLALP
jgi:hypothetical protein